MNFRGLIGTLTFGIFVGITSILWNYQGIVRMALGMIAGVCLMVSLRLFAAEVRNKP